MKLEVNEEDLCEQCKKKAKELHADDTCSYQFGGGRCGVRRDIHDNFSFKHVFQ